MQKKQNLIIGLILLALLITGAFFYINNKKNSTELQTTTIDSATNTPEQPQENNDNPQYYYGIDVSHWNGDILKDIDKLDSLTFGICKATQGVDYVDPDFYSNWTILKQKKLIRGAYHFYLTGDNPITQAEHYYNTIGKSRGKHQMPLIVDIEAGSISSGATAKSTIQQDLLQFLKKIETLSGTTPMIYTGYSFANEYLTDPVFSAYPLWLAEYSGKKSPMIPSAWKQQGYTIWQRTDKHDINSSTVDYDIYYGVKSNLL